MKFKFGDMVMWEGYDGRERFGVITHAADCDGQPSYTVQFKGGGFNAIAAEARLTYVGREGEKYDGPRYLGDCDWCSKPVIVQSLPAVGDNDSLMHIECAYDSYCDDPPN